MTTELAPHPAPPHPQATGLLKWFTSTDHKVIGKSYIYTSFIMFLLSGLMAEALRTQLASPNSQFLSTELYDQAFTIHGTLMLYFYATPLAIGLGNYLVPLMIGAPDVSFPRLNALSYWLNLFGSLTVLAGFLTAGGAADFTWIAYAPLSEAVHAPGAGADLWIIGVGLAGIGTVLGAVNLITTIITLRAPTMTMFRMPIFVWNMLVTSLLIIMAFPVLTSALCLLFCDRHFGTHIFDASRGGLPILWQNLFWFFGHPEVYIIVLPFFGVATQIFPVFSKRPIFGYKGLVLATLLIAGLATGVWAHHFFTYGGVLLPYFSAMSLLIAVPTGIKFFNWIGTMWGGHLDFSTPMLWSVGFLVVFLLGGLSGVMLAMPAINFDVHDTYFVVAHFHYVLFGSAVFLAAAAVYYWLPKMTGRMLREGWGKVHFWLTFIGFNLTFFPQYQIGLRGMPRRVSTYPASLHVTFLNRLSTAGADILAVSVLPFMWNLWIFMAPPDSGRGRPVGRAHPRVGHLVPAAAAQLRFAPTDPLGPTAVGPPPPSCSVMRVAAFSLIFVSLFVVGLGVIYWFTSYEPTGTVLLGTTIGLAVIPGIFLLRHAPSSSSSSDTTSDHVGLFPESSVWPLVLALGAVGSGIGLVFGLWTALPGVILLGIGLIGGTLQSGA